MDKPVRILVGFAPGGTADLIAPRRRDKLKDTVGSRSSSRTGRVRQDESLPTR
jgi:hypothetical protein